MRIAIAIGMAVSLLLGADSVEADDALQGTWKLVSGEADGKALTEQQLEDGLLDIQGDHYTVTLFGMGTKKGEQKLGSMSQFKTIDITDHSDANQTQTFLGIYEVNGDEYRVTFAPAGKARPTTFSTTPDSGNWSHTWKRVTEAAQ